MQKDISEKLLRKFEKELDEHHKTFDIWNRTTDAKFYALLASYDSMFLPYSLAPGGQLSPGADLRFKTDDDSLAYCMRWLSEKKPNSIVTTSDRKIIEMAGELLTFGANYADIADMHMMYGRRLVEVEIDESQRRVKFRTKDNRGRKEIHGYLQTYEFYKKLNFEFYKDLVKKDGMKNLKKFMKELTQIDIKYEEGRIVINDITQLNHSSIKDMVKKEPRPDILLLDESVDMGGFSFGEYREFWFAISNWSNCLLLLYLMNATSGINQEKCMPTQLLEEEDFISKMKDLSGLSEKTIITITDRLTYNWENKKAEILLQPFIKLNRKVLWSPLVIRKSRYERNILKLMSRTTELKDISDNIIGGREKKFLNLIGRDLSQKYGYQFKLNTCVSNEKQQAEIDFLAYKTKAPTEILIVEAKTILAVDETNEISDATKKLVDAQQQIKRAIIIIKSLEQEKRKEFFKFVNWSKVSDYYPIVMTPEGGPDTNYNDDDVPHISYTSLLTFGNLRTFSKPSRLWSFCREKEWIKKRTPQEKCEYKDIKVGNITYSLPYEIIIK